MRTTRRNAKELDMIRKRSGLSCLSMVVGLIFLLVGTGTGWAATYYVDNAALGSNNGTSWTNAWNSFASVIWGAGGVKAADTLYISGGSTSKTYTASATGMLKIGASGTSGSPITIATGAKSPSPMGHDGTVIFEGSGTQWGMIYADTRNYIVLDGEKSGARNWTTQNCTTINDAAPIIVSNGTGNKVSYITILTAGMGIYATRANSLEISYCSITDVRNDCAIRSIVSNAGATQYGLSKFHHNTIQTNYSTVNGVGPDGIQSGTSTDIYNNVFYSIGGPIVSAQHPDMCQTAGRYHRIYNNIFRNPVDSAIDLDAQNNWGQAVSHFWVYNNVFCSDSSNTMPGPAWPTGIRWYWPTGSAISDVVIANNTFVDFMGDGVSGGNCIRVELGGAETVTDVVIKNNLFYNAARTNYYLITIWASSNATAADWGVDYNLTNAGAHGTTAVNVDGSAYTQAHPRTSAPTFVSYTHTNPSNDFHLSALDTTARGQGVDLSAYFTTDKDGVARPNGAAWDIGAYASSGSGTATPNAPTGLRLK